MISVMPKSPITTTTKSIPSKRVGIPEREAVGSRSYVGTHDPVQVRINHSDRLENEPWASIVAPTNPSTIREKYSAGPNFSASSASGGANRQIITVATQPAKNDPGGDSQSRAGTALTCHGVAIETGDHRGRLAGYVDEDRGGGAAVLGTVVDACEHD